MRSIPISILLPVYSGDDPRLFSRCLASLEAEILAFDQIVLVVDGPIGNGLTTCLNNYCGKLPNIEVINIPINCGLISALNIGLEKCRYEHVARIDADDSVLPGRFDEQVSMIEQGADVVSGAIIETGGFYERTTIKSLPEKHSEIIKLMSYRNPINHMATMFRLSKILAVGKYPNLVGNEDYGLWLLCRKHGLLFENTSRILVEANVPVDFAIRRSGLKFARSEIKLWHFRLQNNLGTWSEAHLSLIIRLMVRLLPAKLLKLTYYYLRRSKK